MMAGFTEVALSKKLAELNSSQQSIQTLSLWLIHHRKHHATIVKVWFRELQKAKENRKLTFMYLANDVIQNSKKKGPEFGKEFGIVLKRAFEHMEVAENDDKTRNSLGRILNIWEERGVYDSKTIKEFKKSLEINIVDPSAKRKRKSEETVEKAVKTIRSSIKTETEVKQDGTKEVHIRLSPQAPPRDPPEPEELVKILSDLENSASSDAAIRERIAKLPPEVVNASLLAKLQGSRHRIGIKEES